MSAKDTVESICASNSGGMTFDPEQAENTDIAAANHRATGNTIFLPVSGCVLAIDRVLEMVRHTDYDLLRVIVSREPAGRSEGFAERQDAPRIFVFGKDRHVGRDEGPQPGQQVDPESDVRVALHVHRLRDVTDQCRSPKANVGLKRLPWITQHQIQPNIRDAQMDARYVAHRFDVRLAVEHIELEPHGAVPWEKAQLPPVDHGIFEIKILKCRLQG